MINIFKKFIGSDDIQDQEEVKQNQVATDTSVQDAYSEELIAVITVAVAASMGVGLPDINIQAIRRIPQNTIAWADMGRKEQLFSRLN